MRVRTHLALMAAGILLPIVVMSAVALTLVMRSEREAAQRSVRETARAIALAVDRELAAAEAALRVLANSPLLARGDFAAFYQQAMQARTSENAWILLFDRDGQQVVNTRFPLGTPLGRRANPERVSETMRTLRPSVSNVYVGTLTQRSILTVDVPVPLDAGQRYVLTQAFFPEHFLQAFAEVELPAGWVAAINDNAGRTIARSHRHDEFVGKAINPKFLNATLGRFHGDFVHIGREGAQLFDFFTRSSRSQWLIVVGVRTDVLEAPARAAVRWAAIGSLIAIGVAAAVALLLGRRLVRPIGEAARSAIELGHGRKPACIHSPIHEISRLNAALADAAARLSGEREARTKVETERMQFLEREKEARQLAESQNRAKDQFLAMLGHELRNPLSAVSNSVLLLERAEAGSEQAAFARGVIARQTSYLVRLIDDLLDVGRAITGKIRLQREPLDLAVVVEHALSAVRAAGLAASHQVTLESEHVYVEADRTRIEQIVNNLVSNAIAYTPPGGRVRVALSRSGGEAVLEVSDNGIGIVPENLERVFELFFQAKNELYRKGGLGIGLTLVRRLVEMHHGTIQVKSAGPGAGSTFTVRLPAIEALQPARRAERARGEGRPILLVEDNDDARESLKVILTSQGHTVKTAADGGAAVEAVRDFRPDAAIVDIGLPVMDGYQVARALRRLYPETLLIALTGYGQPDDERRAREAGFDIHVVKPADIGKLSAILARDREAA